jgi:hypothetical protein
MDRTRIPGATGLLVGLAWIALTSWRPEVLAAWGLDSLGGQLSTALVIVVVLWIVLWLAMFGRR